MYSEAMTRWYVYLPASMMLALTRLADRRGVTMASLLRLAVEHVLDGTGTIPNMEHEIENLEKRIW